MTPEKIIIDTVCNYAEKTGRAGLYSSPLIIHEGMIGTIAEVIVRKLTEEGYLHGSERPQEGRSPREV